MKKSVTMASMICAACFAFATTAAYSGEMPEGLLACADERDDATRLACYDAQLAALKATGDETKASTDSTRPASDNAAPASSAGIDAAEIAAVDEFGRTGKLARENAPSVPDSITATIVRIETKARGKRIIHLDNGQVWEENARTRNLKLDEGDEITIESGFLGSFQLSHPDSNRFTRVSRSK